MAIPRSIKLMHMGALAAFVPMLLLAANPETEAKAPRLVGFGCEAEPDGVPVHTLTAAEEDLFPGQCREIVSLEEGCADVITDGDVEKLAEDCRNFWGAGY